MRVFFVVLAVLVAVAFANKHKLHNNHHHKDDEENQHHHDDDEGEEHHHHHHHHRHHKCRGEPIVRNEEFEKSKRECRQEIPKNDEESEGNKSGRTCRVFCALTKVGALDTKGFIVESKMKHMIHSAFVNQEAREEIEREVIDCGRNATDLGIASSDDKCSNYKSYFVCIWESIKEACVDPSAHNDDNME